MRHHDKTMREIFEMLGGSDPVTRAINELAFERLKRMGILDTKKQEVSAVRRWVFAAGLCKDTLGLIGSMPGGQLAIFAGLTFLFFPFYWWLTH
jgi:hypothetical protein